MKVVAMLILGMCLLFGAIDINSANKKELMTLKGVGTKKADAILDYRKKNCFKDVTAITEVKGIGPKFLENNKRKLTAQKCTTNTKK
jgi:competence protein ComEA